MPIYRIYSVTISTDIAFVAPLPRGEAPARISFSRMDASPEPAFWDGADLLYGGPEVDDHIRLYRTSDGYGIRIGSAMDFYLWPDRIVCHLRDPRLAYGVEIWLLGHVLAFWLEWQGQAALHASAAVIDGQAAAFLATNRGGKTSLAASLMQQGCPLLTDDILALSIDQEARGHAAYPELRMWPDLAQHFTEELDRFDTVTPRIAKLRVPAGAIAEDAFHQESSPLTCIYIPERIEGLRAVDISPAASHESLQHLLRNSFAWVFTEAAGLDAKRLHVLAQIVRSVPIRHLRYPDGLDHLPRVAEAVREDVKQLENRSSTRAKG